MPSSGRPVGKPMMHGMHLRIFRLHMAGWKNKQVATELNCTEQTVSNILNEPFFRQAKQDVIENTIRNLASGSITTDKFSPITIAKALAPRMMQLNVAIAENSKVSPNTRLRAIHDVLDRACGKATQRVVVDDLDSMLERCTDEELEVYSKTGQLPEWTSNVSGTVH